MIDRKFLKWPYQRDEKGTHHQDQQVQRHSQFEVIVEAVPAGTIHQQIRLIPDRSSKTGAGTKANRNDKRFGVDPQTLGGRNRNGQQQDRGGVVA